MSKYRNSKVEFEAIKLETLKPVDVVDGKNTTRTIERIKKDSKLC